MYQVPLSLFYALALYVIAPFAHWVHLSHGAHQYYVTTSVTCIHINILKLYQRRYKLSWVMGLTTHQCYIGNSSPFDL